MHKGVVHANTVDANVPRTVPTLLDGVVLDDDPFLAAGVAVLLGDPGVAMRVRPNVATLNGICGPGTAVVKGPGLH